ncbi:hypothetical protein K2173_008633 [Erythroxylum novogranatense]|uniref:Uncharacterized protein n=1 Tax=Erythroxylum novogranatense TaxID=1862640 RepID=A0AAV8SLS1_9ROSI|nr:hypothetical protein K2173_008633 [Erythroxylum novogranatense]
MRMMRLKGRRGDVEEVDEEKEKKSKKKKIKEDNMTDSNTDAPVDASQESDNSNIDVSIAREESENSQCIPASPTMAQSIPGVSQVPQ